MSISICWPRPTRVTCHFSSCRLHTQHPDGDPPKSWREPRISALVFLALGSDNKLAFTFHSSAVFSKKKKKPKTKTKSRPPPSPAEASRQPPLHSLAMENIKFLFQTSLGKVRRALKTRPRHLPGGEITTLVSYCREPDPVTKPGTGSLLWVCGRSSDFHAGWGRGASHRPWRSRGKVHGSPGWGPGQGVFPG